VSGNNAGGLSWELILKRREGMRRAFADFVVDRVAAMGPDDEARLLAGSRDYPPTD